MIDVPSSHGGGPPQQFGVHDDVFRATCGQFARVGGLSFVAPGHIICQPPGRAKKYLVCVDHPRACLYLTVFFIGSRVARDQSPSCSKPTETMAAVISGSRDFPVETYSIMSSAVKEDMCASSAVLCTSISSQVIMHIPPQPHAHAYGNLQVEDVLGDSSYSELE